MKKCPNCGYAPITGPQCGGGLVQSPRTGLEALRIENQALKKGNAHLQKLLAEAAELAADWAEAKEANAERMEKFDMKMFCKEHCAAWDSAMNCFRGGSCSATRLARYLIEHKMIREGLK